MGASGNVEMTKNKEQVEGAQFVRYFGPLLDALRKLGGSGAPSEVVAQIAEDLRLSEEEQSELLDSGAPRFPNQVAWARFYLTREGLLDASKRGVWSLTEKGRATHLNAKEARDIFLKWVKIFAEERKKKKATEPIPEEPSAAEQPGAPPAVDFRDRLLGVLKALPASGFERLCQRLLRESGFVQVVVTGRSGDGYRWARHPPSQSTCEFQGALPVQAVQGCGVRASNPRFSRCNAGSRRQRHNHYNGRVYQRGPEGSNAGRCTPYRTRGRRENHQHVRGP